MEDKILIVGGDARLAYGADELERRGKKVMAYGNGLCNCCCADSLKAALADCKYILCSIPFSRDNGETVFAPHFGKKIFTDDLLSLITPEHTLFAGMPGSFMTSCAMRGATIIDYNLFEDFQIYNAHLSAEAILSIIINNLPVSISDSSFLILGYGRIGKELACMLKNLGGDVTATARKASDFALMSIRGINSMYTKNINTKNCYSAVINTIPQKVTDDKFYENLNSDCLIIDASASPGYMDTEAAESFGLKLMGAFGLPGKYSPASAGKIIVKMMLDYISKTNL